MSMRRIIVGFLVCFSMAVFAEQAFSQTRGYSRTRKRSVRDRSRSVDREQRQQLKQQLERQLNKQMGPAENQVQSMKQVLRATQEQWKAIKPKLDKVRKLRDQSNVSIKIMRIGIGSGISSVEKSGHGSKYGFGAGRGGGSGGTVNKHSSAVDSGHLGTAMLYKDTNSEVTISSHWRWFRPSQHKGLENLNEGERICEELFELLENNNSELEKIKQKMQSLQKFRQKAKKELAVAQQELRESVTPHQEAMLVMMQLLD